MSLPLPSRVVLTTRRIHPSSAAYAMCDINAIRWHRVESLCCACYVCCLARLLHHCSTSICGAVVCTLSYSRHYIYAMKRWFCHQLQNKRVYINMECCCNAVTLAQCFPLTRYAKCVLFWSRFIHWIWNRNSFFRQTEIYLVKHSKNWRTL